MGPVDITRNKREARFYLRNMPTFGSRHFALPLIAVVATLALPLHSGFAQFDPSQSSLIDVTGKAWKNISVIKVENSMDNIYSGKLVWLTLQNGVIDSYKAQPGWRAEVSSSNPNSIQFSTDSDLIRPGESVRFGIKSDQPSPVFQWIVMDEEGDELGSGTLDVVKSMKEDAAAAQEEAATASSANQPAQNSNGNNNNNTSQPSVSDGSNQQQQQEEQEPQPPMRDPAVAIVSDEIRPGIYIKMLGEGFTPNSRITVLLDGKLIGTLRTEADGTFKGMTKIPEEVMGTSHQIAVSDNTGRATNLPITVAVQEKIPPFTLTTEQESYKRGDLVKITGMAIAGAAVSLRAVDPAGNSIFSSAVPVDRESKYVAFVPLSPTAVTGDYLISAFQEGRTITSTFKVLTEGGKQLSLVTDKFEYKQGESVVISGEAAPNKDVTIKVLDPNGAEVFTRNVRSDVSGNFTTTMIIPSTSMLGKYSVSAMSGEEEIALTFTIARGSIVLTIQTDKNEYRDGELVRITGKGKPMDRVSITILTPKEDRIPMSANTKEDGTFSALWLIQKTATPGTYEVIAQQGGSRAEAFFAVFS